MIDVMPVPRHWDPVKFASIKVMLKYNVSNDDGQWIPVSSTGMTREME